MTSARSVAVEALMRIEGGAYANLVLPALLERSGLDRRDRGFVTELVYGTTRMRRACDWLVDRFVTRPLDERVRAVLRLGAYQVVFLETPRHAAVDATVGAAPVRARGLVNAVLRRVADAGRPDGWPDEGTRLSYPDWVVERLTADLGIGPASAALEAMNAPAKVTTRVDGYVQDLASQWVAEMVAAQPGDRIADICAAPGGKATVMAAARPSLVVAGDSRDSRARLMASNIGGLGLANMAVIVADGRRPPLRHAAFDRVLVDAPCSGLGVLRRRPDARWRIKPDDVDTLAVLQRELLDSAAALVRPGGTLVYAVCTMTRAETLDVDAWLAEAHPELEPLPAPSAPWQPWGRGALLLPQTAGTDGMFVLRSTRRP
ncbi:MAG TPA: transcription antitermination factor NusB [Acidimicrobiales bacterium]|nr:transcription antitermination factor NusB [Acidimicrobiales bacterium]